MAEPARPPRPRVVMYDTFSGTNDYAVELVRALGPLVELTVVTVDDTRLQAADCHTLLAVVPAFAKPQPRWRKALQMAGAYLALVRACLRQPRQTVLHVQLLRFERLEVALFGALQRLGVRLVATAHNALPHDPRPDHAALYARWYRQVDVLHVLSDSVLATIREELGVRPRRAVRIGHGPYTGMLRRHGGQDAAVVRQRLGIGPDRFVILQFGLFKRYKGAHRLAAALAALPPAVRPLVVLAGGGPLDYAAEVRTAFDAAGRSDCLLWLQRYVADDELCGLLLAADLVVFPYVKVSQSGALLLAMTFGKPCLCAPLPGFLEALPDAPGLFVDPADTAAFAQCLQAHAESAELLAHNRAAVRRAAAAGADWAQIAAATARLYDDVLRAPPGGGLTRP